MTTTLTVAEGESALKYLPHTLRNSASVTRDISDQIVDKVSEFQQKFNWNHYHYMPMQYTANFSGFKSENFHLKMY